VGFLPVCLIAFIVLQAIDMCTTLMYPQYEANPFIKPLLKYPALYVLVQVVMTIVVCLGFVIMYAIPKFVDDERKRVYVDILAKSLIVFLIVFKAIPAINNLIFIFS